MQTWTVETTASRLPVWLWAVSILGVLWNLYGVHQFASTFTRAGRAAMTAGMTAVLADSQAALYLSLPGWISVLFAVGVFGGLIGSVALALRQPAAGPVLTASLVGPAAGARQGQDQGRLPAL